LFSVGEVNCRFIDIHPCIGSILIVFHNKIDVLSPIEGTYQNNNLFYFPESYERLENIVKIFELKTNSPVEKFIVFKKQSKGGLE
jgi:hypothetical protein